MLMPPPPKPEIARAIKRRGIEGATAQSPKPNARISPEQRITTGLPMISEILAHKGAEIVAASRNDVPRYAECTVVCKSVEIDGPMAAIIVTEVLLDLYQLIEEV